MNKRFNLSRYKELFKLEENRKISFLDETYLELLKYRVYIHEQISYNHKEDYLLLIHEYLSQIISSDEFRSKFLQMEKEDSKKATLILEDFQKLEIFTFAEGTKKFFDLISEISTLDL